MRSKDTEVIVHKRVHLTDFFLITLPRSLLLTIFLSTYTDTTHSIFQFVPGIRIGLDISGRAHARGRVKRGGEPM